MLSAVVEFSALRLKMVLKLIYVLNKNIKIARFSLEFQKKKGVQKPFSQKSENINTFWLKKPHF